MAAEGRAGKGEDPVALFKPRDSIADRLDFPGQFGSQDRISGSENAEGEATKQAKPGRHLKAARAPVAGGHGGRSDPH